MPRPEPLRVCEFLRALPGEVLDVIYEYGLDYDAVELALEVELEAKWREKVARGERVPLADNANAGPAIEVVHDR